MNSIRVPDLLLDLLVVAFAYIVFGIPVAHILGRVGINRWWSILTIIPIANLIGLWIFAYSDWPNGGSRHGG
jgi:hypothetical protein